MAKQDKSKLKDWFRTGNYPTQEQFWDWMDSYIHRDDQLRIGANFPELDGVLQQKVDKEVFKHYSENKNNPHHVTKQQVGLGLADNTADLDKPLSRATQSALELKADKAHLEDITNPHRVSKQQVGLGHVDNTADLDKPISKATQAALYLKANHTHLHDVDALEGFDTDTSLSANSDEKIASQKAVKTYVDNQIKSLSNDSPKLLATLKEFSKAMDNDLTLAANSDKKIASQKAVKAYVDALKTTLQAQIAKLEKSQLIPGMIMAWKGSIDTIPAGWKLSQELKDKFILGAGADFKVGATGGERMHQLKVEEMPEHAHPQTPVHNNHYSGLQLRAYTISQNIQSQEDTYPLETGKTGSNQPHNNMPPYYALAYIEYVGHESLATR